MTFREHMEEALQNSNTDARTKLALRPFLEKMVSEAEHAQIDLSTDDYCVYVQDWLSYLKSEKHRLENEGRWNR